MVEGSAEEDTGIVTEQAPEQEQARPEEEQIDLAPQSRTEILPELESEVPDEPEVAMAAPANPSQQPIVTEELTRKTQYTAGSKSPLLATDKAQKAQDLAGIPTQYHSAVQHLADLAKSGQGRDAFTVYIIRKAPPSYDGYRLRIGENIDEMKPIEAGFIKDAVREFHGGGKYMVSVVSNETGQQVSSFPIDIDQQRNPPLIPDDADQVGGTGRSENGSHGPYAAYGSPMASRYARFGPTQQDPLGSMMATRAGTPPFATLGPQNQDMVASVNAERSNKAEVQKIQSEMQLEEAKAKRDEQQMRLQDMRDRRENRGQEDTQKATEGLRSEMKEMFSGFKEMVTTIMTAQKPDNSGTELLAKAMETSSANSVESMKSMVGILTAIITSQGNKGHNPEMTEALKLAGEANNKVVQMAVQGSGKFDELLKAMFLNKINQGENSMQQWMTLQNSGYERAMDIFKLVQGMQGDDDDAIDPEAGFGANLGNMFLKMVNSAVTGITRMGGDKLANALGGAMTPRQPMQVPTTYTPQPQLPAPQAQEQQTQLPLAEQTGAQTVPQPFEQVFDDAAVVDFPTQPQGEVQPPAASPVTSVPTDVGDRIEGQIIDFPNPQNPEEAQAAEERLSEFVTEAMEMAMDDFQDGRREHSWPEHALGKWNRNFLDQLLRAPDDHGRLQLIRAKCDAGVFGRISQRLMQGGDDVQNFTNALRSLLTAHGRAVQGVAA